MARPQIELTDKQIEEVETLAAVLNQEQIADYFGIDSDTFTAIKNRNPEVFRLYKRGKARAIENIGSSLIQKAKDGDASSMMFYLKTQAGWKEKTDPAVVVNVPKSIDDFYIDDESET